MSDRCAGSRVRSWAVAATYGGNLEVTSIKTDDKSFFLTPTVMITPTIKLLDDISPVSIPVEFNSWWQEELDPIPAAPGREAGTKTLDRSTESLCFKLSGTCF